jgi:hypothetical protein
MATKKVADLRKLQSKLRARSAQLEIPRKIGFSKEEKQIVKKPNVREITRNLREQIVSYTLPQPKPAENTSDKTTSLTYGAVSLPATRNKFNGVEFFRTLDTDIETYTRKIDKVNIKTIKENSLGFPDRDGLTEEIEENRLNFSGEMIRVGSGPTSYFYIEDGKFYTMNGGLFSLLAEKLGKPLGMRINDDYDYTGEYKPAGFSMLDFGQNQYSIYNKETYSRNSIAYVESNEYAGDLTKQMILGPATDEVVFLTWQTGMEELDKLSHIRVSGVDSTPVTYQHYINSRALQRNSITSTDNDLQVTVTLGLSDDKDTRFEFFLYYTDGTKKQIREVPTAAFTSPGVLAEKKAVAITTYKIPKEDITTKVEVNGKIVKKTLYKIEIKYFDGYAPFGNKGKDGELRWESFTRTTTKTIKRAARDKRGILSKFRGKRRGLLGRLFGRR